MVKMYEKNIIQNKDDVIIWLGWSGTERVKGMVYEDGN